MTITLAAAFVLRPAFSIRPIRPMSPIQLYFSLTQNSTTERGHSLVCIPDRMSAEVELMHLKAEYGPRLLKHAIRKDRPGKKSTYTLRYFTTEHSLLALF